MTDGVISGHAHEWVMKQQESEVDQEDWKFSKMPLFAANPFDLDVGKNSY